MNSAIELHDSECISVECDPSGAGEVVLTAFVHRYEGELGSAPHIGGDQRIRMKVGSMVVVGELGELPATIYEGSLAVMESVFDNIIPFPAKHEGILSLKLTLADDARIVLVTGRDIEIVAENSFRFIENVDFTK